jgi:transglutaminase-like putative cysteine protease
VRLVEVIKRANQPQPPAESIPLRLACGAAVMAAIAACHAESELATVSSLLAIALVAIGMTFSYRTRERPPGWVKVVLAVAAVAALVWFFNDVSSHTVSDITTIENPLTALFVWIQVVHSFHVPARRDLAFSLAGSAGLMAVAGAQAIDLRFALYAVLWAALALWGLSEMWSSASGGGRLSPGGTVLALGGVIAVGLGVFLLLPAPRVAVRVDFLAKPGSGGAVGVPGSLAGDAAAPTELAHAGTPSGGSRIGGYLGFANRLDTALRGRLGNTVVMRVRAARPSYWVGETFDSWDGQGWTSTAKPNQLVAGTSPLIVPTGDGSIPLGQTDLQTFFVATSSPDLVFHAESAREVWFPAPTLFAAADGTLVSPIGLGKGAVYTVESAVATPNDEELRATVFDTASLPAAVRARDTQLPRPYPQVQALARSVTAGRATTYDKVQALIGWIGANTRYSTDIPPLPPGGDTVNEFLFGNRVGFCEQISTALTVMLRSLGIPAREAVGYVPGPYNPITDLYEVQAKDAHAWVQVWFPEYGWQSFDPTASVPDANPSPGATALGDLRHALARVPVVPTIVLVVVAGSALLLERWRRRRPATWAERVAREFERAGTRAGRPRRPSETIDDYAAVLEGLSRDRAGPWRELASQVSEDAYGGRPLSVQAGRAAVATARAAAGQVPRGRLAAGRRARS